MPTLVPVDDDPFAAAQQAGSPAVAGPVPKLVPVDADPFAAPAPSMTETAARAAAQGLTYGLADEAYAAGRGAKSWMNGQGFQSGYDAGLAEYRAGDKAAAAANPVTNIVGRVTGSVATAVPAAGLVTAATLPGRLVQSGLVGAGMGAGAGFGEGEGTDGRLTGALHGAEFGGAFGVGGEALATGAGAAFNKFFGGATTSAPGVVPAQRIAAADEFAIPLTRGQATGNVGQQAYEEAARNQARGGPASALVQGFDAKQAAAVQAARQGISDSLGGQALPAPAMGEAVRSAVIDKAQALKAAAGQAYDTAASKNATIGIDEIGNLAGRVKSNLDSAGLVIDPNYGSYPGAQSAMNILNRVTSLDGAPQGTVAQSLSGLDQARKAIGSVKPANAEDARAIGAIRKSFDGWLDDAIDNRLFSGDQSAIDDLKQARSLWSQYKGLTTATPGDAAPSIIVKMQRDDITGEQAANWLLGTAGADQAGRSAAVAQRLKGILGKDSPEWEALRQAAYTKMMEPARGNGGNQAVSSSMLDFLNGQGAPLAKALFTPEEIGQMSRLAAVLRSTVTDPRAANPSKSGYEVARLLGSNGAAAAGAGVAALGTAYTTGDPKYLAIAALPLLKNASSLSKGIAATKAQPSSLGAAIGTVARVPALAAPAGAAALGAY